MKHQRQIALLTYINEHGEVSNADLAEHFGISKATLNRDLTELEKDGLLRKVHGGVVSQESHKRFEAPSRQKEWMDTPFKEKIAEECLNHIHDNQIILLDSGSTTQALARRIADKTWKNLTIVCNDIRILSILLDTKGIDLFVLGGPCSAGSYNTVGSYTRSPLANMHVDLFFLGTAAFNLKNGVTYISENEAELKKDMIACADKIILVSDSTKYDQVKQWTVCPLSGIDRIITDDRLDAEAQKALRDICDVNFIHVS